MYMGRSGSMIFSMTKRRSVGTILCTAIQKNVAAMLEHCIVLKIFTGNHPV